MSCKNSCILFPMIFFTIVHWHFVEKGLTTLVAFLPLLKMTSEEERLIKSSQIWSFELKKLKLKDN